jgi:hypothetical protein
MADVKFGIAYIHKQTPPGLKLAVRIISIVLGVSIAWLSTSDLIPAHAKNISNGLMGLVLTLMNSLSPLFGINKDDDSFEGDERQAISNGRNSVG